MPAGGKSCSRFAFPGSQAGSWCSWLARTALLLPGLCDSSAVKLLLRVADDTSKYKCCLQSLFKNSAMSKYNAFLCLYSAFNLSVCKAYEGETNHSSLNWLTHMGLAVLPGMERQNSVIPFLGFFSHRIFTHILSVLVGGYCHEAGQILTRLSRKVVSSPSLEILRTWLDKILSNLLCFGPSLRRELEYMKCLST